MAVASECTFRWAQTTCHSLIDVPHPVVGERCTSSTDSQNTSVSMVPFRRLSFTTPAHVHVHGLRGTSDGYDSDRINFGGCVCGGGGGGSEGPEMTK